MKENIDPEKFTFHASVSEGLHEFLEKEVESYSLQIISKNRGGVFFKGKKNQIKNFALNTRFSSKISFEIANFKCFDAQDLYEKSILFPWEKFLQTDSTFKIESLTKDHLNNSRFAMYKLKDSIMDRFRKKIGDPPSVEKDHPDLNILLRSFQDTVSISISISNSSITKRGYREKGGIAPLRENLAQAVLAFSGWDKKSPIIDPMCGSGTILIEAALLLQKNPLNYKLFSSSAIFLKLFGPVQKFTEIPKNEIIFFGYDKNTSAIQQAIENAEIAGVENQIKFEKKSLETLENSLSSGFIISNPPYGERLENKESAKILYSQIGRIIKEKFKNFQFTAIAGDKSLLGFFKLKEECSMNLTIANWKAKIVNYKIR